MAESTSGPSSKKKLSFSKDGKKSKKKFIVIGVLALMVLAGVGLLLTRGKGNQGEMVTVKPIQKGSIEQKINITGTVQGTDSAEISSNLPYEVLQINFKEGDVVKKGDVLAVLDDRVLRNELNMTMKELELSELQLKEQANTKIDTSTKAAQIQVNQSTADAEEARRQLDIKKSLYDNGAIPKEEYMQAELAVQKAQGALNSANESLRKTKEEIAKAQDGARIKESQRKSIEIKREQIRQKQSDLDKVQIKSPIDGTITRVNAKLGRLATATGDTSSPQNRALFIVENLSDLRMKVGISEYDIGKIKIGQKAWITSDILGSDRIEAEVVRIAPTGESKEGSSTKEMVIPVTVSIIKRDPRLIAGITAQATIEINKKDNVLKVPIDAIYQVDGNNYLAFSQDGIVKTVPVTLGLESVTEAEVNGEGIKEGDMVILNPRTDIKDGDKVTTQGGESASQSGDNQDDSKKDTKTKDNKDKDKKDGEKTNGN